MASNPDKCLRCGAQLNSIGVEQFRVGGTSGGWSLLLGQMAEVGEGLLAIEVLACTSCRKVEIRLPAKS